MLSRSVFDLLLLIIFIDIIIVAEQHQQQYYISSVMQSYTMKKRKPIKTIPRARASGGATKRAIDAAVVRCWGFLGSIIDTSKH